jgi:hypothetical protein
MDDLIAKGELPTSMDFADEKLHRRRRERTRKQEGEGSTIFSQLKGRRLQPSRL